MTLLVHCCVGLAAVYPHRIEIRLRVLLAAVLHCIQMQVSGYSLGSKI
jgi:hypothetical protein